MPPRRAFTSSRLDQEQHQCAFPSCRLRARVSGALVAAISSEDEGSNNDNINSNASLVPLDITPGREGERSSFRDTQSSIAWPVVQYDPQREREPTVGLYAKHLGLRRGGGGGS